MPIRRKPDFSFGRELPRWLQEPENYIAQADRDSFLDKSTRSILSILHRLSGLNGVVQVQAGHPLLKLLHALVICYMVVASHSLHFLYFPLAWVLVQLAFLPGRQMMTMLKASVLAALVNALVLVPAIFLLGETRSSLMVLKLFITVSQMQLFALTTAWHDVIVSLRLVRVPSIFIFILHISLKYMYLLGRTALELLYALRIRSVGHSHQRGSSLGGLMGTLFVKSRAEAEALYQAMIVRGFDGNYQTGHKSWPLVWQDGLMLLILVFIMYAFYMGG